MPSLEPGGGLRALILAAGIGRRLGAGGPKALLRFGDANLLERHLTMLGRFGVDTVDVVAGFESARIAALLDGRPGVSMILNERFREGSVVSLQAGAHVLRSGAPVILMDADVLCDFRMMARLVGGERPDVLLVDRDIEPGDEPVKVCVRDGRIVDFRKAPTEAHDWHGESVGFFRLSPPTARELADRVDAYVASGRTDMEYEEPIRDMMLADESAAGRFGFEDVTGLPWTEIDFPEDVEKARALLPELAS